ncbi:uncharacterized protein [Pseudorasbora parva]|uniref:uncharacterized protein isoform X1 n=1 Tax=Pseudorasbora parva TaxID=51549 RepID=UPI00351EF691
MLLRCQTPFRILILMCMASINKSSPLGHGHRGALSFSHSLRLTRTVRARVQQLLSQYKQQVFGGEFFEYGDLKLSSLPSVTVSYETWLHMQVRKHIHYVVFKLFYCMRGRFNSICLVQDTERLRLASHYLQTFWTHLEGQRQQFEKERDATKQREQRRDKRGRPQPTMCQRFMGLQIDLRDLMRQVNTQLKSITQVSASTESPLLNSQQSTSSSSPIPSIRKLQTPRPSNNPRSSAHSTFLSSQASNSADRGLTSTTEKQPTRASTPETKQTTTAGASLWIQHLRGYVMLKDLERYLSRLARDYTVLQAKY